MGFDTSKTISYWLNSAEYDLGVAESLLESGKYPYALFFGHLALEKILKALVVKETKQHAQFTHSLTKLANQLSFDIPKDVIAKFLKYEEFNIQSRYPDIQNKFYKTCTKKITEKNVAAIKEVFNWLKKKL